MTVPDPPDYRDLMDSFAAYVHEERPQLNDPADVARLMRPLLADRDREELHALLLDNKNHLLADELVSVGLVDRAHSHPREVFRAAIAAGAARVILVHNHPSGDPTPSREDIARTRRLVEAGKLIEIPLVDHVILGRRTAERPTDYVSLREKGLLDTT